MIWTHLYDLIIKIALLLTSILILTNIPFFEEHNLALIISLFSLWIGLYLLFGRTIGSYLYAKLSLKMDVSFKKAKELNIALSPLPKTFPLQQWVPLKEVIAVQKDLRFDKAIELINIWQANLKKEKELNSEKENPKQSKLITVIIGLILFGCFASSFYNLPPASYFIKYYCKTFDTDQYPLIITTLLTFLFCLFPIAIVIKFIKKSSK